jgi:hypothetical protein
MPVPGASPHRRTEPEAMDTPEQRSVPKEEILKLLEARLGRLYVRQRLGIEAEHEARMFGRGLNFFQVDNW